MPIPTQFFQDYLIRLKTAPWAPRNRPRTITATTLVLWLIAWLDWASWYLFPIWLDAVPFTAAVALAVYWLRRFNGAPRLQRNAIRSLTVPFFTQFAVFVPAALGLGNFARIASSLSVISLFAIGLAWTVWFVDRQTRAHLASPASSSVALQPRPRAWNPFDLTACYYRSRDRRLDQSALTFITYTLTFTLLLLILSRLSGCREIYEMPAGGGQEKRIRQVLQIQKIIKKKYVINPFSAVLFNPPPVEDIPLNLERITENLYTVGQGESTAAGFAAGTSKGKVRFIRLEYDGGDWDQDFGIGADLNMLLEYGIRTSQKVAGSTESRKIRQLANFPQGKSPPLVYITGQRNIFLSDSEIEILRDYTLEKHGMIFADNGGSSGWHGQFFEVMRRTLPKIAPVRVPLDHPVHRLPYAIPFLPYVAPHGGKDAWGWVVDGRLVAYYHPGDIGDAWADGHAGVRREIWEHCYQLGTNVIFYAHSRYNRWLKSQATAGKDN